MQTTSVKIALSPQSTAFVQQAIAAGKTADDIINEALNLLQRLSSQEERQQAWLREELRKGEDSGEPLLYTAELLNNLEKDALAELEAGDMEIDPSVWPATAA
jgi:putative addiction module CopG family antidote